MFIFERGFLQNVIQYFMNNVSIQIYVLFFVALVLFGGSFLLSVRLYQNKDL